MAVTVLGGMLEKQFLVCRAEHVQEKNGNSIRDKHPTSFGKLIKDILINKMCNHLKCHDDCCSLTFEWCLAIIRNFEPKPLIGADFLLRLFHNIWDDVDAEIALRGFMSYMLGEVTNPAPNIHRCPALQLRETANDFQLMITGHDWIRRSEMHLTNTLGRTMGREQLVF